MSRRALFAVVAVFCLHAAPANAQLTEFFPAVGLELNYSDNVLYENTTLVDPSDAYGGLTVTLPLRREWTGRVWELTYDLTLERYDQFDGLDNDSHEFRTTYESRTTPASGYELSLGYDRSQTQGDAGSFDSTDLFTGDRSDRERYRAAADYDRSVGKNWRLMFRAAGAFTSYDDAFAGGSAIEEERTRYGGSVIARRLLGRNTSLGGSYAYARLEVDSASSPTLTGTEDDHFLGLSISHASGRDLLLEADVGVTRRESDVPGTVDDTEIQGRVSVSQTYRRFEMSVTAERLPSTGGLSDSTAVDTVAGIYFNGVPRGLWRWDASARYVIRDPNVVSEGNFESVAGEVGFEWFFHDRVSFGGDALYVDQSRESGFADPSDFVGSYYIATVKILWYPRGNDLRRRGERP